jgi:tRNA pseudouridine65 synthase
VLHTDADLAVVWKPNRLLVHRTDWAIEEQDNLKRWLVEELGDPWVQPVHRLDRPTSGLVVFARTPEAHAHLHAQFVDHTVEKSYVALVRGWLPDGEVVVEKPLANGMGGQAKPARTDFTTAFRTELPIAITRYPTSRLSIVACRPATGRYHQIRLHLRHLRHPVVGDIAHGDREHNRYFATEWNLPYLLLHAHRIAFTDLAGDVREFAAPPPLHFVEAVERIGGSVADIFGPA